MSGTDLVPEEIPLAEDGVPTEEGLRVSPRDQSGLSAQVETYSTPLLDGLAGGRCRSNLWSSG